MKILYIAHARIPTEKAHGLTIVKSCEAFARAGATVELLLPRRKTPFTKDLYETYAVEKNFTATYLKGIDALGTFSGKLVFFIQSRFFYFRAVWYARAYDRKEWVIYTRDYELIQPLARRGFKVIFECHALSSRRDKFFAASRKAHRIVVISKALKDAYLGARFQDAQILVAPSGVDLGIFQISTSRADARSQTVLPTDGHIITYTGNFTTMGEDKGISTILKSLPFIPKVLFVAVGGSTKDIERYQKEAEALGVASRIVLRGHAPQSTLALYERAADVLLMPFPDKPHYRNHMSPVKMFEYMASGTPIVATNLPTIREVLNDTNATLIPPEDPQSLAPAVSNIFAHIGNADIRAQKAILDVMQYSWSARTERVISFIQ